jgi:hypothetical protein
LANVIALCFLFIGAGLTKPAYSGLQRN